MSNLYKKYLILFLILCIFLFSLSGCYNVNNIDRLAYVVAVGFDTAENGKMEMTFQIAIPSQSGGGSEGGSSQSSSVVVNSIVCNSLNSGINLLDSYVSKKINLSHCRAIIFSEEIASLGIQEYIYTLINHVEIRPDTNIIVSKGDAKSFIENAEPTLETLSARYYEIIPTSSRYTAFTENATIGTFFANLTDTFIQPSATLGSINNATTHSQENPSSNATDSSYTAGQTPIDTPKTNIENMGLAVFSQDKLVGELNGIETISHMMVTNQLQSCRLSVPSPFENLDVMDLTVRPKKDTKVKVKIVNGAPYVSIEVKLLASIASINKDSDFLIEENLQKIEDYTNTYIKKNLVNYLYKTSKEYKSDVAGIGKFAKSSFLFWEDWNNYDWLNNYQNAFFDVSVDTTVRSSYLLLNT